MRFKVLGPLGAEADGRPVRLGGPRQRAVLAVLLIARGRMVSAEQIVSEVWEGLAPPSPTTLHAYVSELREALELWRGPAYAEFVDAGFAVPETARLEDLRAGVREDHLCALIELGRHAEAIGPLEVLVADHPLRERGWELLALAQYRAGRRADALATLRAVRERLADELGIEPGPALRALESAVFAQDTSLDPVEAPRPQAPPPAPAASTNLPFSLSAFVGREADLELTARLLDEHRLVTLTGPGGVGKTRLSLEAARRREDADGPWLVELAALQEPDLLGRTGEAYELALASEREAVEGGDRTAEAVAVLYQSYMGVLAGVQFDVPARPSGPP